MDVIFGKASCGCAMPHGNFDAAHMKLVQWVRFTWELDKLPTLAAALPARYFLTAANRGDEKELRTVIERSFVQDTSWGDAFHEVNSMLDRWLERAFEPEKSGICLALRHGSFATAQTFALMKEHGTYLVPTLTVFEVYYVAARDHPELLTPGTAPKELANDLLPKKNFPLAVKSGVKIAYGTDIGEGDHTMEFGLMIAGGLPPMSLLVCCRRHCAHPTRLKISDRAS